jgi:hypothetical protein
VSAEFVNDFTKRKGNLVKAWKQTFIFIKRKRGEQPVLRWRVRSNGYGHK